MVFFDDRSSANYLSVCIALKASLLKSMFSAGSLLRYCKIHRQLGIVICCIVYASASTVILQQIFHLKH